MSEGDRFVPIEQVISNIEKGVRPINKEIARSLREVFSDSYACAATTDEPIGDLLPVSAQLVTITEGGFKSIVFLFHADTDSAPILQKELAQQNADLASGEGMVQYVNKIKGNISACLREANLVTAGALVIFEDTDSAARFTRTFYPYALGNISPDQSRSELFSAMCAFGLLKSIGVSETPMFTIPVEDN